MPESNWRVFGQSIGWLFVFVIVCLIVCFILVEAGLLTLE